MLWLNTKRVLRSGFLNFWRNGVVSLASILVFTVTLFAIGSVIFIGALLDSSLAQLKEKVDVNIYFTVDAPEDEVKSLQKALEDLPEVASVTYTSREQALAQFKERHKDDYTTLQALEELDDNPLPASLNVKAKETSQYESIAKFLDNRSALSKDGTSVIEKVNYYQNKVAIDRLTSIIDGAEKLGFAIIIILIIVSVLITFNTVRLAIYTSRQEIFIMKLMGASNMYVRGPFIIEGIMYGVVSALISMALFYPVTMWIGDATQNFFSGINLFSYYIENFASIFLVVFGSGIILGIVASYLAVRKYLHERYLIKG